MRMVQRTKVSPVQFLNILLTVLVEEVFKFAVVATVLIILTTLLEQNYFVYHILPYMN